LVGEVEAYQHRVSAAKMSDTFGLMSFCRVFFNAKKGESMSFEMIDTQVPFAEADCQSLFRN